MSRGFLIQEEEFVFRFSRGGGPGGQNVNKVNTRVTVLFDAANSESFSNEQKERILKGLASRADKDGVIRVVSQQYRTQKANKDAAVERLEELLRSALKEKKIRKKTKVPEAAKRRRLERKKRRSFLKKQRAEKSFECLVFSFRNRRFYRDVQVNSISMGFSARGESGATNFWPRAKACSIAEGCSLI
jgi:ribosome-associated protein